MRHRRSHKPQYLSDLRIDPPNATEIRLQLETHSTDNPCRNRYPIESRPRLFPSHRSGIIVRCSEHSPQRMPAGMELCLRLAAITFVPSPPTVTSACPERAQCSERDLSACSGQDINDAGGASIHLAHLCPLHFSASRRRSSAARRQARPPPTPSRTMCAAVRARSEKWRGRGSFEVGGSLRQSI